MNDLEQLRDDVRATAPQPRPEFAARLERQVEAGFEPAPAVKAPRRRRINLWAPGVALGCTVLIALVIGVATTSNGGDDQGDSGGGSSSGDTALLAPESAPSDAAGGSAGADEAGGAAEGESPQSAPPAGGGAPSAADRAAARVLEPRQRGRGGNRVVEQRTALELETGADKFTEVTDDVLRVADDTGTIVQSSRVSEEDGRGFARYDLQVPASRLDETLADLSRLAHVTSRNASSTDITRAYVSATDRLDDARAQRAALLKALERADTDAEAEALRRQIRIVRARIAIAERDVAALERRADRAQVTVTVRSTGRKTDGGAWTPGDAIDDAGRILEVAAGVVVVTAAALLPIALLAALAAIAGRSIRRRRREGALEAR